MTLEALVEQLAGLPDPASRRLVDDLRSEQVQSVLAEPARESARSLGTTFTIRARTSESSGIKTEGLTETVARLTAMAPQAQVLLFHFSGAQRIYSVFLREADEQIIGVVMVERIAAR